jgi:hypothetical protein
MVAGKPQTRCAGPISGAPSEQPDPLGVSFLLLPLHSISMKTATPFPWTGPAAAENIRTGFCSIFEPAPRPAARCNPQGVIMEMNSAFAQALRAGLADQRALRLSDLVASDDREATKSLLHNLLDCTCNGIRSHLQDSTGKEIIGLKIYRKRSPGCPNRHIPHSSSINSFGKTSRPKAIRCSSIRARRFPFYFNFAIRGRERLVREVVPRYTGASEKRRRLGAQSSNRFAAKCGKASHPCCSPANWLCPYRECPDLRRKRYKPSTIWPAKCA